MVKLKFLGSVVLALGLACTDFAYVWEECRNLYVNNYKACCDCTAYFKEASKLIHAAFHDELRQYPYRKYQMNNIQ